MIRSCRSASRLPKRATAVLLSLAMCAGHAALPALATLGPAAARAQELPRVAPAEAGFAPGRLERVGAMLDEYVVDGRLPGAVVAVLRDGAVVYEHATGFADLEARATLGPDAIFRIASQTKAIVSVAVLMLQEEGALLISDPVGRYLPAFTETSVAEPLPDGGYDVVAAQRPITVRDLLTHTAGIAYGMGGPGADRWREAEITGWYFAHRDELVRATVDRMGSLPFQAQPGERFVYGYNTDILGALVEEVSGQSLEAFLHSRIFEPLDMRDTHFYLPPEKRDRLATVYNRRIPGALVRAGDGEGMDAQGQYVDGPRMSFSGGAGLLSTARDYARFLQTMLNGGTLGDARILSPASVALMTSNHVGDLFAPGMGFGLGFSVRLDLGEAGEPGSLGDYGWGGAYHTAYWVDPVERLVVVYFTQVIPAAGLDDHQKLRALVYGALGGA